MEANIFKTLRVEQNEVVMCRFLANLLDPKGQYGQAEFQKSFLEKFKILKEHMTIKDVSLEKTCVMTE